MADNATITMRAAYTAQALATMGSCPIWDAALADYLRKEALDFADYEFGKMNVARETAGLEELRLAEKYGKCWLRNAEARAEWQPSFEVLMRAEDEYRDNFSEPHWDAARRLMEANAPTLAAALFKVMMIQREELEREGEVDERCMAFVIDDMARIGA